MNAARHRHWFAWASLLFLACARAHAEPAAPDPLLAAIPPEATLVALADLRPDTATAKAVAGMQTPEQAALIRAAAHLGMQRLLGVVAPGLQLETDVLPWLTRRAAFCSLRAAEGAGWPRPGTVLLIETTGGTAGGAGFERLVQAGVQAGRLAARAEVAGVPAWQPAQPGAAAGAATGFVLARHSSLLVVGDPEQAVAAVLQHVQAKPAPATTPVAETLNRMPPGVFRLATVFPAPQPQQQGQMGIKGVSGLALSVRMEADALVADGSVLLRDEQRAALAGLKATFGESVAGIPETAAGVLVASRPGPAFHAIGLPLADAIAGTMFGAPPWRPMGEVLGPLVSDLLNQEVAVALMPSPEGVSWLAAVTTAQPDTLVARVHQFVQAGQGAEGVTWSATPVGDTPAWGMGLARPAPQGVPPPPPLMLHFAAVDARLLVAGDRTALEAGVAALAGKKKPVTAAAWYPQAQGPAEAASWLACADVRTLARFLSSLIPGQARLSAPHVAQVAEALLVGVKTGSVRASIDGHGVHAVLRVGIDPAKMAGVGATMPAAVGLAVALPALARARSQARSSVCLSNMKQLCMAALMYAQDHNEQLPPAENWVKALEPYHKNAAILRCPVDPVQHPCSYALNKNVAQLPMAQIERPAETVLFYETTSPNPSPSGAGDDLTPRHGGVILGFADGHVMLYFGAIRADWWDPAAAPK